MNSFDVHLQSLKACFTCAVFFIACILQELGCQDGVSSLSQDVRQDTFNISTAAGLAAAGAGAGCSTCKGFLCRGRKWHWLPRLELSSMATAPPPPRVAQLTFWRPAHRKGSPFGVCATCKALGAKLELAPAEASRAIFGMLHHLCSFFAWFMLSRYPEIGDHKPHANLWCKCQA